MLGMSTCLSYAEIQAQLRPADFGGVSFFVDSASEDYGVRAVVHEFPNSNQHFTENLGRKARMIRVEGYFVGEDWLASRDKMIVISESGSPHTLRHPFYHQFKTATCLSFSVNSSKEELGVTRFSLELVEELSVNYRAPTQFLKHLIQTELDSLISVSAQSLANGLSIRNFGDMVRVAGVGGLQGWAEVIDGSRILSTISSGAALAASIGTFFDSAGDIIDGAADIGSYIGSIVDGFRAAVTDPASAVSALEGILFDGAALLPVAAAAGSVSQERQTTIQVDRTMRRCFGGLWAEFLVSQDYPGQREATVARNKLVRWVESEMSLISPDGEPEVFEAFDRFRSRVVTDMEQKWTDSAPVLDLKTPRPTSAVALATQLYGDPARAAEIWERNPSPSMSLVGPDIEVLAR